MYAYFYYNVFEPQPVTSNDRVYELFKVFPGYGSCQGYRNARFWGGAATIGAFLAVLTSSFGLCVPHNRKKTSSSGTSCVCCAVICGIVTLSVWAGSVVNFQTSTLGSGFWCMVSAIVLGVCSIPCLSAYALVATEAPEFQQPPAGNQYHYQQYQPGQQYQYGTAPGQQYQYGHYPPAPPVARQPPPDYQQYYYQP